MEATAEAPIKTFADYSEQELAAMCHAEHLIILRLQNELVAHQQNWNAIEAARVKKGQGATLKLYCRDCGKDWEGPLKLNCPLCGSVNIQSI